MEIFGPKLGEYGVQGGGTRNGGFFRKDTFSKKFVVAEFLDSDGYFRPKTGDLYRLTRASFVRRCTYRMSHSSRFRLIPLVFSLMGESGDSGDDAIRNGTSVCPYRTLMCTSLSNFYPRRCVFLDQGSVHRRSLMLLIINV